MQPHFADTFGVSRKANEANRFRRFPIDHQRRRHGAVPHRESRSCNRCQLPQLRIDSRPGISWIPSAIYGGILWIWWAAVAYLLWHAGDRYPFLFRSALPNVLFQIVLAIFVCAVHLACLHIVTRIMGQIWPKWHTAGVDAPQFFDLGRYILDFLVYALVWSASAIVRLHIASQRQAFRAIKLCQQLSSAKLLALDHASSECSTGCSRTQAGNGE